MSMVHVNRCALYQKPIKNLCKAKLLEWINELLDVELCRLEELKTGAAYCQIVHLLYPECINLRKVKFITRFNYEFAGNYQLLKTAFNRMGLPKQINIDELTKGHGHFEFCSWMHTFYEDNIEGKQKTKKIYNAKNMRDNAPIKVIQIERHQAATATASSSGTISPRTAARSCSQVQRSASSALTKICNKKKVTKLLATGKRTEKSYEKHKKTYKIVTEEDEYSADVDVDLVDSEDAARWYAMEPVVLFMRSRTI